jgi:hypothetical protein
MIRRLALGAALACGLVAGRAWRVLWARRRGGPVVSVSHSSLVLSSEDNGSVGGVP